MPLNFSFGGKTNESVEATADPAAAERYVETAAPDPGDARFPSETAHPDGSVVMTGTIQRVAA